MGNLIHYFKDSWRDLSRPSSANIASLDFLRILAVMLVIIGHFNDPWVAAGIPLPSVLRMFGNFGWTGVDLFFILSGFLISGQIFKELERTGKLDISRFFLRRGFRIWPLYFVALALITFGFQRPFPTAWGPWPDLLFFSNFIKGSVTGGWSLSTEEQFYLIAPISFLLLSRKSKNAIPVFYAAAFLALPCIRYWVIHSFHVPLDQHSSVEKYLYFPIFTHSDALVSGSFLAWLSHRRIQVSHSRQILLSLFVLSVFMALRTIHRELFGFSALAVLYFSMTWLLLRPEWSFLFPKALHRPAFLVSRLTYGMYLNHFEWTRIYRAHANATGSVWIELILFLTISAITALVTFLLIERPFLLLRDRSLRSPSP